MWFGISSETGRSRWLRVVVKFRNFNNHYTRMQFVNDQTSVVTLGWNHIQGQTKVLFVLNHIFLDPITLLILLIILLSMFYNVFR